MLVRLRPTVPQSLAASPVREPPRRPGTATRAANRGQTHGQLALRVPPNCRKKPPHARRTSATARWCAFVRSAAAAARGGKGTQRPHPLRESVAGCGGPPGHAPPGLASRVTTPRAAATRVSHAAGGTDGSCDDAAVRLRRGWAWWAVDGTGRDGTRRAGAGAGRGRGIGSMACWQARWGPRWCGGRCPAAALVAARGARRGAVGGLGCGSRGCWNIMGRVAPTALARCGGAVFLAVEGEWRWRWRWRGAREVGVGVGVGVWRGLHVTAAG